MMAETIVVLLKKYDNHTVSRLSAQKKMTRNGQFQHEQICANVVVPCIKILSFLQSIQNSFLPTECWPIVTREP
jgi:hypothetical protein